MLYIYSHAHIITMDQNGEYENGYICTDTANGRILDIGPMTDFAHLSYLSREDVRIIDLDGSWILPAFIDSHSHLGLFDDGLDFEGDDGNEDTDPITPQVRAIDGVFNGDPCFREAYEAGVGIVMTGPGSGNVMGGQFAILKTYEKTVDRAIINAFAAQKAALGENPKRVYGKDNKTPATRMGSAALLRDILYKAKDYENKWTRYQKKADEYLAADKEDSDDEDPEPPDFDLQLDSLLPLLRGQIPLKIHAHRQDDILTAVRLCNEFGLSYTLDHCTEGYLIADILADEYQAGHAPGRGTGNREALGGRLMGVIIGPVISDRSKPELSNLSLRSAGTLKAAGLPVCVMTDHPCVPQQYLSLSAALTVRGGMDSQTALQAITTEPARLLGIDRDYGSLAVGKMADMTVFTEHPFSYQARVRLFVGGGVGRYDPDGLWAAGGNG